ncbi:hypothetical protein WH47_05539 [Habropoda laboriosa]|uniref:Uncharacterized protein n=1 Tax=Habropoda laboriosa TaxID=597456 RepID=A0A0L7RFU3_9HYME|nr:hypothetical protein WH47_05539 [Habropoda laboriosa]
MRAGTAVPGTCNQEEEAGASVAENETEEHYSCLKITVGVVSYRSTNTGQKLIAQARSGSLENWNKYWEEQEGRRYDLCGDRFGNLEHLTRDCRETERDIRMEDVASGRQDRKIVEWLEKLKKREWLRTPKRILKYKGREGRRYDLCGVRFGNLEHLTRDCRETERDIRMEDVASGRQDRKIVEWLEKLKKREWLRTPKRILKYKGGVTMLGQQGDDFMTRGFPVQQTVIFNLADRSAANMRHVEFLKY